MRSLLLYVLASTAAARRKQFLVPHPSKGEVAVSVIPKVEVVEEPVVEMVPAYAPLEPVNILVALPPQHTKDQVIHGEPDLAPGLPYILPVESISAPNWRPVAIVKPPPKDPQFIPKFAFGKEPGPLFDRPAAVNKVAEIGNHYVHFDDYAGI